MRSHGVPDSRYVAHMADEEKKAADHQVAALQAELTGSKSKLEAALAELAGVRNLVDPGAQGRRELALGCVATGAGLLALLPVGLAFFGSPWQGGRVRREKRVNYILKT